MTERETLVTRKAPEDRELERKLAELARVEAELEQGELDLATLRAELRRFESRYLRIVGSRYAELDEIEAQIAELQHRINPSDEEAGKRVGEARKAARESAQATSDAKQQQTQGKFQPTQRIRRLYREVAKRIHPDLGLAGEGEIRRHRLMAEANRAYEDGDEERLEAILQEWDSSPDSVKGDGPGAELVRAIRKIAQAKARLEHISREVEKLGNSDLYALFVKVEEADAEGRDLLAEMADRIVRDIAEARVRLEPLRSAAAIIVNGRNPNE